VTGIGKRMIFSDKPEWKNFRRAIHFVQNTMLTKNNIIISILFISIAMLHIFVYWNNYPGLSGDDFFRALMTYEWSESHFTFSKSFGQFSLFWFPAHFWMAGTFYHLIESLNLSLKLLSLIFGFLEITFLFYLTKTIFDKSTATISIFLVGFLPFQIWLNLSMTSMTIYLSAICGGCLFLYKWIENKSLSNLILSSFFFLFSTMLRPEGWIFTSLYTATVIIFLIFFLIKDKYSYFILINFIVILTIPYFFIYSWLFYNYAEFGDCLYFLKANKISIQGILEFSKYKSFFLGFQFPFLLFITSPLLNIIAIIGVLGCFKKFKSNQRKFLYFIIAHLFILIAGFLLGPGTVAAPQRYAMSTLLLLIPYAAFGINTLLKHKHGRVIFFSICITYLLLGITKSFMFSTNYLDAIEAGKYIKKSYANHFFTPNERICTDYALRKIAKIPFKDQKDYFIQASVHAAVATYSGKPRNFLLNILKMDDSRDSIRKKKTDLPKKIIIMHDNIYSKLKKYNASIIILSDRDLIKLIPDSYKPIKIVGQYLIFSNTKDEFIYNNEEINSVKESFTPLNLSLNKSTTLIGYRYDGLLFKTAMSFLWKIEKLSDINGCEMQISLSNINNPKIHKKITIKPITNWLCNDAYSKGLYVIEKIPISLPVDFPGGKYSISLSLIDNADFKIQSNQKNVSKVTKLKLKSMELIHSKRKILLDAIKNRSIDLKILAMTLLII
jgi:hypothetical protein